MSRITSQKTIVSNLLVKKTNKSADDIAYNYDTLTNIFRRCDKSRSNYIMDINNIEGDLIPSLRSSYGIPAPSQPMKKYGGWTFENPIRRRFDFYTGFQELGFPGTEVPLVCRIITNNFAENAEVAAKQIIAMKDTAWGIDPSLSLAIAVREGRDNLFIPVPSSFACGGLDNFGGDYDLLKRLKMLPPNFSKPSKSGRAIYVDGVPVDYNMDMEETNEAGNVVLPAQLEKDNQLEAYAATVNLGFLFFVVHCLEIYGICTEIIYELNKLTTKQRRIWNGIYFMGTGRGKKLVNQFYENGWNLKEIENLTEKISMEQMYQQYMRGIVTAADAHLLDTVLSPGLPLPTERAVDYNWDSLK